MLYNDINTFNLLSSIQNRKFAKLENFSSFFLIDSPFMTTGRYLAFELMRWIVVNGLSEGLGNFVATHGGVALRRGVVFGDTNTIRYLFVRSSIIH